MREKLAERLLGRVLGWDLQRMAEERPRIEAMASYKYDEYQLFSPGMRFVESLASWLWMIDPSERQIAYDWVMSSLIFNSTAELGHLVAMAYPDHIRPILLADAAHAAGLGHEQRGRIVVSAEFRARQRQCLILGMSDGSRIDALRRANPGLSNEQFHLTHEIAPERVTKLLVKLREDVAAISGRTASEDRFTTIVLADDFSGSGYSYLRDTETSAPDGKIGVFYKDLKTNLATLVDFSNLRLIVLLYVANVLARDTIEGGLDLLLAGSDVAHDVEVVQLLPDDVRILRGVPHPLSPLIEHYYDPTAHTSHTKKGGTKDMKYGFRDAGLPFVQSHNTPNNSIALLWAESDDRSIRALFPRVSRHKDA